MSVRVIIGDALTELRKLPDESVHCCVTSPPYYGLRDYGTAQWDGGDAGCDHLRPAAHGYAPFETSTLGPKRDGVSPGNSAHSDSVKRQQFGAECGKCGARRIDQQIGLEPSPDEYVAALVSVFREVRRVLRKDATLWLNIGDSYASNGTRGNNNGTGATGLKNDGRDEASRQRSNAKLKTIGLLLPALDHGCKPKDLIGIPWLLAFALRSDGWYLRQDIIWSKPNPMPESVTDRCTKAHEYLFLLSKSERYFYDAEAIKEASAEESGWAKQRASGTNTWAYNDTDDRREATGQRVESSGFGERGFRNKRSVWEVTTQPFSLAHFATFPPALIEPCIKAGCPESGTVLDPFGGAGTTGLVADRLGRDAILVELNPAYADMARRRIEGDAPLFTEVA